MDSELQAMVERLAIEQAVYGAIGKDVGTGKPDNLRGQVDEVYRQLHAATGATSFDVMLGGEKVGTYVLPRTKGKPARTESYVEVVDRRELDACDDDDWLEFCNEWLDARLDEVAKAYVMTTGAELPGVAVLTREVPATPDGIGASRLRVDAMAVADVLGPSLPSAVAGLLGGGEE